MSIDKLPTIEIADKVLLQFNDDEMTGLYFPFIKAGIPENEIQEGKHSHLIANTIDILIRLGYIEKAGTGHWYSLTDLGRQIKDAGGHLAYEKIVTDKAKIEKERQERNDKADELDLQIKTWQVRTKYLPYIVSILALGVSIFSYFKPEKKQVDLQPMQQKIQQLQDHVKSLDSLLQSDSLLKRHK